jgi:hypothetical protein
MQTIPCLDLSRKDPPFPTKEISAARRARREKFVSDNSKCIRTSEGGREINFQFSQWGGTDVFQNDPLQ